jgi:hypothetical protein
MCDDDKQDPIVMFFIAFRVCVCVFGRISLYAMSLFVVSGNQDGTAVMEEISSRQ